MSDNGRREKFILKLAKNLHINGAPAPEIERIVTEVAAKLSVETQCFSLPTLIGVSFGSEAGAQRTRFLRMPPSEYDMSRLVALEAIAAHLSGPHELQDAEKKLGAVVARPRRMEWSRLLITGPLISASIAVLLRGGLTEMACGALTGFVFAAGYIPLSRLPGLGPVRPVILCAMAAFVARGLAMAFPDQTVFITILSGIILMIPGFTTTVALSELATMNLISGAGRFAGAIIVMLMMVAGVVMGNELGEHAFPAEITNHSTPIPIESALYWVCVAGLGASFIGVLKAPLKSAPIVIAAALMASSISIITGAEFGPLAGAFTGSFVIAGAGHLYQRLSGRSALLVQVPGLLSLVPGSVGFRGLSAIIEQNFIEGLRISMDMVLTATALAIGTLLANGLAPIILGVLSPTGAPGRSLAERVDSASE